MTATRRTDHKRAIEAVAQEIEPWAFGKPEPDWTPEVRAHILALRKRARRIARLVIEALVKRGWEGP